MLTDWVVYTVKEKAYVIKASSKEDATKRFQQQNPSKENIRSIFKAGNRK
jgi:hypothetical protein